MKRVEVTGGIQHLLVAWDVGISCISAAELAVAWMLLCLPSCGSSLARIQPDFLGGGSLALCVGVLCATRFPVLEDRSRFLFMAWKLLPL